VLGPDFTPKTIPSSHPQFEEIVTALKANDNESLNRLIDLPTQIAQYTQGLVTITDRVVMFNGRPVANGLATRISEFMKAGQQHMAQPLINFLEKVMENPSYRAVNGLFEWIERAGLPLAPDGDIFAWKIVGPDYMSLYGAKDENIRKFDNTPGNTVEVERNEVDEDPNVTCSHGLHFCSTGYLPKYGTGKGNRIVIVKLHPKDVVAFPRDYNTSKGRACRYEVVGEIEREKAADFFPNERVYEIEQEEPEAPAFGIDMANAQVGDRYLTRNDEIATITGVVEGHGYPIRGTLDGCSETLFTWTIEGLSNEGVEDGDDLVSRFATAPSPRPVPVAARRRGLVSWFLGR
jgi:hypothetical protein